MLSLLRRRAPVALPILASLLMVTLALPSAVPYVSAQSARNLSVLVGAGEDTLQALAYFPQNVRVRQGDTVTWKLNGDELHTVSFTRGFDPGPAGVFSPLETPGTQIPGFAVPLPGGEPGERMLNPQVAWPTRAAGAAVERYTGSGLVSSGILGDEPLVEGGPLNETFALVFPATGMYTYLCLVHPDRMFGTIEVVEPNDSAPEQAAITSQAQAEILALTRLLTAAQNQGENSLRQEPGLNGATTWYVRAGNQDVVSGDSRAQVLDFAPKRLVVTAGDTVVWAARYFHTVSFVPAPPAPEFFEPEPQSNGPALITLDPVTVNPAKPSAIYNPTQYFNSGLLGQFNTLGDSWTLTFTQPGVYEYQCLIHDDQGMKGTIIVQAAAGSAPIHQS
jgi:plastocyanin